MAKSGQVFKNPKSGETITFIKTSKDTNGEFVLFELCVSNNTGKQQRNYNSKYSFSVYHHHLVRLNSNAKAG